MERSPCPLRSRVAPSSSYPSEWMFPKRSDLCQLSAGQLALRSKPHRRNRRASVQGSGQLPGQPRDRRRPMPLSTLGCWFSTSYRRALLRPPTSPPVCRQLALFPRVSGLGIVRDQPQNADRRGASDRSVSSASGVEDLPCLRFRTLASFGSCCRLLPGLTCLRLYRSWVRRLIGGRRCARICWLFLGRRTRLWRRCRSCRLLLRKQQARCDQDKGRDSRQGCSTHVCTVDSRGSGLETRDRAFWWSFFKALSSMWRASSPDTLRDQV